MAENPKLSPVGRPPSTAELSAGLAEAMERPASHPRAQVALTVTGGLPGERHQFSFVAHANGTAECELNCEISKQVRGGKRGRPAKLDFAGLLRAVDPVRLLAADIPMPRFPPDSLIGRLELSDGDQSRAFYYLADPGQAETAGQLPPETLLRAVNAVYQRAEKLLGSKKIRP